MLCNSTVASFSPQINKSFSGWRYNSISKVYNRNIGESDEFPGPVTKQLLAAYSELVGLDIIDQSKHYGNK